MYRLLLVALGALLWQCCQAQQRGLFPAVLNLASMSEISANATCGETGPEMFCKLVEHVPGQPARNPQCRVCNLDSTRNFERHPIQNAIDGTNRWWQSPSIKNGMDYHYVTITLDLQQVFQIAYVIVKAANSPRPGNWVLERSLDGVTFEPWQYYAITDSDCLSRFGIAPRTGPPSYTRDDEVICTSFYSKIHPLENGEIHTSLINGRPSADDPSPTLLNFTSARYIRMQLQRIRTLNADLMTLAYNDPRDVDPIVTRRYYYSLKDISVGGMCICYGHAKACPLNDITKKFSCECEHNTCGESCDRCCPGYNQKPWMAGTFLTRHVCEKCNCHGKSEECVFNQTVAEQGRSLNTQGVYAGGGACLGCRDNTAGVNCQSCRHGYYRPEGLTPDEDEPCQPCSCDLTGSLSQSCVSDADQASPGFPPGACPCKEGFGGPKCDRCAFGFRGYPSCVRCSCSRAGSTHQNPCNQPCRCKENVEGENCSRCKSGFYDLRGDNPLGCEKCSCMGVASQCSASTWTYQNATTLEGWSLMSAPGAGRVWPIRQDTPPYLSISHSDARTHLGDAYYWSAPDQYIGNKYLGNKLEAYGGSLVYTVSYEVEHQGQKIRVTSEPDVIIEGGGVRVIDSRFGQPVYPSSSSTNQIDLLPTNFLVQETGQPISRRDFLLVLTNVSQLLVRASYSTEDSASYRLLEVSLEVASASSQGEKKASAVEICTCPPGYSGTSCQVCDEGHRRVNGTLYGGVCESCRCHDHATDCDAVTGHCLNCTHLTTGAHCDTCLPGYYGDPTRSSATDCQPCACPLSLPGNNFSPTCHLDTKGALLCDRCQPGYTGSRCDSCASGYYGRPAVPGGTCQPCPCNDNLDLSLPHSCDPITGTCLHCRKGYGGVACDTCAESYYGDAINAKDCLPCRCHGNGSVSEACDQRTGQCMCRDNVMGRLCNECKPQSHGLALGGGCVPCHCNSFGSKSFDCDEGGQCLCQPGVGGAKCDRCSPGHFDFQEGGCTPCQCSHVGNNCDDTTGRCVCPPNTVGETCDRCAPNHWGHDIITGCKDCGCAAEGSVTQQCNLHTGCCFCRDSFRGEKCNECQLGYRDYPQCTACDCEVAGSETQTCDLERGMCACAPRTGVCSCKANVQGSSCGQCRAGSFGLSVGNPQGCSQCYCYGHTQSCSEAQGLIRMWLSLKPEQTVLPLVDRMNKAETTRGVTFQHPEILAHADLVTPDLAEPYYWRLPEQFQGSMITAYGGKLKYAVYFEARDETGPASYEPQVIIRGGPIHDKVMTRHVPGLQIGQLTRHEIDMTEHEWKQEGQRAVSREDFMDVLFYVDFILIKASHGNAMRHSRISEISLEVAEEGLPSQDSAKAHQIEKCDCPLGYSGLSCEECSAGFYRLTGRSGSGSGSGSGWSSRSGVGSCVQCQCNQHSENCDPDTSICKNCQHHTDGDRCERCAPGFYGVVRGFHDDCKPCACPLTSPENNFSPTCVSEGFHDYRCTACPEGYEGKHCERCATGYHGDPRLPGGRCEECKCAVWGAWPEPCDPLTGQCRCRAGSRGRDCSGCMERHVCGPQGVISCDDDCSGLLISDMERLNRIISDVNLTSPLPPPYRVLYHFENITQELRHMLSPQRAPERLLQLADSNLNSLVTEMDQLLHRATNVSADGEQSEDSAERTLKRAEELERFIKDTLLGATALKSKADELNLSLSRRDGARPEKSLTQMNKEIQAMLAELRKRHLGEKKTTAEEELGLAVALLQKVQRLFGGPHQATEDLKAEVTKKMSDHHHQLQEAQALLNAAQGQSREAGTLAARGLANLTLLERQSSAVGLVKEDTEEVLLDGNRLLTEAYGLSEAISKEIEDLEQMESQLGPLHDQLDYRVGHLSNGLRDNRLANLLKDAEKHAHQLNESAGILDSILADAKNRSLNATEAFRAYTRIKDAIDEAERTAKEARGQAGEAFNLAVRPEGSLKEEAKASVQKSLKLLSQAKALEKQVKENDASVEGLRTRVKAAGLKNRHLVKSLNDTMATLQALPTDTAGKLQDTKQKAGSANETANEVLARLRDLNLGLHGLQGNYSDLQANIDTANQIIQDPEKNIHAAGAKVKDLEDEADRLLEKLEPIRALQDNLKRNISQIKELITQARKQANSIKVSVSSGGNCIRGYRPDIRKGRYNTIVLNVKTVAPDNLLFYLGSAKYVDFLALEMRKGKVWFLWDVGSGVGRVEYPDLAINDGHWHRIEASRTGLKGSVSVRALEGPQAGILPVPQSTNGPEAFTILDVDQQAYLFVGGILGNVRKAEAVRTSVFSGCMGETSLDNKPIGLWNYRDREGDCTGCVISPQPLDTEGTVQFDGEGYAAVTRPTRWNPNTSSIMFNFRTFSADAVLLYLATNDMKDFMSVELIDGRIKVSYDLGSGTGSASSTRRHNNGHWKSFTMSRSKKQAKVTIVDMEGTQEEVVMTSSQGSASGLNLLENQKIYFGGLPTQGTYRSEVGRRRYAGCLRDIEVSRTPYDLLSSSEYTGITKGCAVENLYTVSFSKPGFMELPGFSFAVATEISLSFATQSDTGTILLATGVTATRGLTEQQVQNKRRRRQSGEPYVAVILSRGTLEVLVHTGSHSPRRVVRKPDQGILHDGREHSLRIQRLAGRSFIVQVDEEAKREAGLPNDQPMALQRVFVGGVPAEVERISQRGSVPFMGCVWNLMVDSRLADFSQPSSFENAEIGQCPNLAPPPPPLSQEEEEPEKEAPPTEPAAVAPPLKPAGPDSTSQVPCVVEAGPVVLEKATQFGLTRNSHVAFSFDDTKVRERLIIEFDLRTEADSGLVFYMARVNHADFVTIQIKEGMAHLAFDLGHGNTSVSVPRVINDGQWHKIRVHREKQRGILTVDSRFAKHTTSPKKADLLDVVGMLYVGGLPLNYTTKRIGPVHTHHTYKHTTSPKKADLLDVVGMLYVGGLPLNYTTKRIGPVLHSINGCLRNLNMLGNVLDMATPTSSHMVGSCFVSTETGTYFHGTGYLKAVASYRVGLEVTFDLEFRTTKSSGVLLGVSSARNDGLGLELDQGKLLFRVDNGAGPITAEYQPEDGAGLCDGQWHSVTARKLRHRVELVVDGKKSESESPNARSNTADTNDPIYVGGHPEGVRQAALSTSISFRGCMRNLQITKSSRTTQVHFNKALEIRGVQPLSCPATSSPAAA
ncbi:laminin subunit alpha-2 [Aplochiton taeniatus]